MTFKYLQWEFIKTWTNARTLREKILLIFGGGAFIFLVFHFMFERPTEHTQNNLEQEIISANKQIQLLREKTKAIVDIATQNSINQKLAQQKSLSSQSGQLKQRIDTLIKNLVKQEDIPLVEDRLSGKFPGVKAIDLKVGSTEPLIPISLDSSQLPAYSKMIYRKNFEMHFQSNFFQTVAYLDHLETLPWHIYWESLDYRVTTYPQADIIIKFYILINQMS